MDLTVFFRNRKGKYAMMALVTIIIFSYLSDLPLSIALNETIDLPYKHPKS